MVIPRGIYGFRDCIAELRAMGIQTLPASRLKPGWASRKRTLSEWIYLFVSGFVWSFFFRNDGTPQQHHLAGLALVALLLLGFELEHRKTGKSHWISWLIAAAVVAAVAWRW
jgi:hypothetical protein